MKKSRLVERLDAEIAAARTPVEADPQRAERAAYLARLGRTAEARAVVREIHARHDAKPQLVTSVWLHLVEGLVVYFENLGPEAYDRVRRAHALSSAGQLVPMQALTAAWLAQLDYMRLDLPAMARHLGEALQLAAPDHHGARSRASLVAALALQHAGETALAAQWNARARDHARQEGDDVTISALMHNMAWARMSLLRQWRFTGGVPVDSATGGVASTREPEVLLEADSTGHFDELIGSSSWQALRWMLKAQILSLKNRPAEALQLYRDHLAKTESFADARLESSLLADLAWCCVALGDHEAAELHAEQAAAAIVPETHVDERAATHSRLAQTFELLGDTAAAQREAALAADAWAQTAVLQRQVIDSIGRLDQHGQPS